MFAEGFALSREAYKEGFTSREDLRRVALWQWLAGSETSVSTPERRSHTLVKTFHEQYPHQVASTPAAAPTPAEFAFEPGQNVYVVAYLISGPEDVNLEGVMVRQFARQKIFHPTGRLSEADFVFLVYSEYKTRDQLYIGLGKPPPEEEILTFAEGFAVTPAQFEQFGLVLGKLRQIALWYQPVGSGQVGIIPVRRNKELVKRFHEEMAPLVAAR